MLEAPERTAFETCLTRRFSLSTSIASAARVGTTRRTTSAGSSTTGPRGAETNAARSARRIGGLTARPARYSASAARASPVS